MQQINLKQLVNPFPKLCNIKHCINETAKLQYAKKYSWIEVTKKSSKKFIKTTPISGQIARPFLNNCNITLANLKWPKYNWVFKFS